MFTLPGGSTKAYWLLNILEGGIFILQWGNSLSMTSNIRLSPEEPEENVLYGPMGVIFLTGLQGLMAGIVFCNTYVSNGSFSHNSAHQVAVESHEVSPTPGSFQSSRYCAAKEW
jgi:hypothetical protein